MKKIVLFVFAGRKANLEIQRPYIDRILDEYPQAEYHLWDLTRTPEDGEYVRSLDGQHEGRVRVLTQLHDGHPIQCRNTRRCRCIVHRPPYEKPFEYYANDRSYRDAMFVKLDDDVLFLETKRFGDLLVYLDFHPNAVFSANVVNNVVCAKHDKELREKLEHSYAVESDKEWWLLHTDADFARACHSWFLDNWRRLTKANRKVAPSRALPGEFVSINCIAFTHPTMKRISSAIGREGRLGDEGAVDRLLPRIATGFRVAHLTFGPQDKAMSPAELDDLRSQYAALSKEYLK